MTLNPQILAATQTLWDYNREVATQPQSTDLLLVMGTNDLGVPRYAATLPANHAFGTIVVTGGVAHENALHTEPFGGLEATVFQQTMHGLGCPEDTILVEDAALNTGDNITKTRALLQAHGIAVRTGHLVHTPTMQRRALATAMRQWPEVEWTVSCQSITLSEYLTNIDTTRFINGLVGDTFRILDYPARGYQVAMDMPETVRQAMQILIDAGYNRMLPKTA